MYIQAYYKMESGWADSQSSRVTQTGKLKLGSFGNQLSGINDQLYQPIFVW